MKRNMEKIIDEMTGRIPERYELTGGEWLRLVKKARGPMPDDTWNAIIMAFEYGFALAQRYEKRKNK